MKGSKALLADAVFLFLFTAGVAVADGMSPAEWQKVEKGAAVAPVAEVPRFQPAANIAPPSVQGVPIAAPIEPTIEPARGRDLAAEEEKLLELERQMLNKLGTNDSEKLETFDEE